MITNFFQKHKYKILIPCIILFSGFVLHLEGHSFFSQTGKIYLWWFGGGIEDSQQLMDWYSFSHFIHGVIFFFLIGFILRKFSRIFPPLKGADTNEVSAGNVSLLFAVCIEACWEMLENSPLIINRYREGALAAGYFGDSILNSTSDICFMILGFLFAYKTYFKFGWKASLAVVVFLELFTLYFIHDNLTLNIIMLLYPFKSISTWQTNL